jgi:hypothetical protein
VSNIKSNALNLVSTTPKIDIKEINFIEARLKPDRACQAQIGRGRGPASKPGQPFKITKKYQKFFQHFFLK